MKLIEQKTFDEIIKKFNTIQPIIVLGDVGVDKYTQGVVNRISPEAPVPIVEVVKEWETLGLASNISNNLSSLGVNSTLCSSIGDDQNANRFENLLEAKKLTTWGIVRDRSRPTIFKERIVTDSQQVCRIDYEKTTPVTADTEFQILERVKDFSENHSCIIIEDYCKGTLTEKVIKESIKIGKNKGIPVMVDPGRTTSPIFYKGADLIKPNLREAKLMVESLVGAYEDLSVEEMCYALKEKLEIPNIVITLGAEGIAYLDKNSKYDVIPTVASEVFDVSGAGDTTISLLATSLLCGSSLGEAAWIANCGAGVVVAKKGTATVNLDELKSFYQKLKLKFH